MSEKFQDKYRIPSARLQNWDYGWNAAYFITICTAGQDCIFGKILDGKMILSNLGYQNMPIDWDSILIGRPVFTTILFVPMGPINEFLHTFKIIR